MKDERKTIGWMDVKTEEEKIMFCKALGVELCQQIFDFLGIDHEINIEDIKIDDEYK